MVSFPRFLIISIIATIHIFKFISGDDTSSDEIDDSLVKKALEGFRNIAKSGDDYLDMPQLDPLVIEDNITWNNNDITGKSRLLLESKNNTIIKGFSSFDIADVITSKSTTDDDKVINIIIKLKYNYLQGTGVLTAVGFLLSGFVPILGNGNVEIETHNVVAVINTTISVVNSYVYLDSILFSSNLLTFKVKTTDFILKSSSFINKVLSKIVTNLYKKHYETVKYTIDDMLFSLADDIFGGMTEEEFIDFLTYLSSKAF